jgi:hypothetical protein
MEQAMAVPAASHGDPESSGEANGKSPSLAADPLRRLEAELGDADGGRADDEQLYAEAQGLVEEAWSLVTECLVLRDGLLDACHEIEQTMEGIQQRLAALPFALETNGQVGDANGAYAAVAGPVNGAATINGASQVNGVTPADGGRSLNGAGPLDGGATV